jgi:hypothetical protein
MVPFLGSRASFIRPMMDMRSNNRLVMLQGAKTIGGSATRRAARGNLQPTALLIWHAKFGTVIGVDVRIV